MPLQEFDQADLVEKLAEAQREIQRLKDQLQSFRLAETTPALLKKNTLACDPIFNILKQSGYGFTEAYAQYFGHSQKKPVALPVVEDPYKAIKNDSCVINRFIRRKSTLKQSMQKAAEQSMQKQRLIQQRQSMSRSRLQQNAKRQSIKKKLSLQRK